MQSSRMTKAANAICAGLILSAGALRLLQFSEFSLTGTLISAALLTAALLWTVRVRQRLAQPEERKYLTWVGIMIVVFLALRTLKYQFLPAYSAAGRYVWYLYYLPQTFLPLLMFFAVLHIGKPVDQPISRYWRALYLPAALIVLGVLTNDMHNLAFIPLDGWESDSYRHGALYFAAVSWMALLFAAMLAVSLVRCAVPSMRKNLWMPLLPLAFGVVYTVSYILNPDGILPYLYKMPEAVCFVCAAFLEGLILARLLPTNDNYYELWCTSELGGGIVSSSGDLCYPTRNSVCVSIEDVRRAALQPIGLQGGNLLLNSRAVHGGWGYWTTDMTEINLLNARLEDLGDVLSEENSMLEGENELRERRLRIEQQAELYGGIELDVAPQLHRVSRLLALAKADCPEAEKLLKHAAVLTAYIKRRCNLLLLSHQQAQLPARELSLALTESLEYIRLCGIEACGEYKDDAALPSGHVLLAYRLFETALEERFDDVEAVSVNLRSAGGLRLNLEIAGVSVPRDILAGEIAAEGGSLSVTCEDGSALLHLRFPEGGAGA